MPLFAVPAIEVRTAVEVDGFALASLHDSRVQHLAATYPNFKEYLNRFTNEFGIRLTPSLFIYRDDAPQTYRGVDAIVGFRDALAMSIIPQSWAHTLRYSNSRGIRYSDYFAVYPWMIENSYGPHLITKTLNLLGFHEVQHLQGQPLPALTNEQLDSAPLDNPLLKALLNRWETAFGTEQRKPEDVRLFRSLNMAYAAARLPGGADAMLLDIGRAVALWSSAFEILTPSKTGAFRDVYALLAKNIWRTMGCQDLSYQAYGYAKDNTLRNLPAWLFGEINRARNDYLHGNPIGEDRLIVPPAKRPLHLYTSMLYRMALAAYLNLKHTPLPQREGETEYETYLANHHVFGRYQGDIEIALSSLIYTDEEWRSGKHRHG
jgi:hypothetical protein